MKMVTIAVCVFVFLLLSLFALGRISYARTRTEKRNGSYAKRFVWVEDGGTIRQLTQDEHEYLNTEFLPGDGARPQIKPDYSSRTPDNRISGFLLKKKLPLNSIVESLARESQ